MDKLNKISHEMEKIEIPHSLSSKSIAGIKQAKLEMRSSKNHIKRSLIKAAAVVICICGLGLSFNIPSISAAVNSIISYFTEKEDSKYQSERDYIVASSEKVEKQVTDNGISLTIDEVSMDESTLNVFYTIKSDEIINKVDSNHWTAEFTAPFFKCAINGQKVYKTNGAFEDEAYFIDDYTIKGLHRLSVAALDLSGDSWLVDIGTESIFNKEGSWNLSFDVEKNSTEASVVVNPGTAFSIPIEALDCTVDLTVDKLVIAPSGNNIVLSQKVRGYKKNDNLDSPPVFTSFALIDNFGRILDVLDKGHGSNRDGTATNIFEFLKARPDTSYIKLVPFKFLPDPNPAASLEERVIIYSLDNLPIRFKVNSTAEVVVTNTEITPEQIKVDYYYEGILPFNYSFFFYNDKNESIYTGGYLDFVYDRATYTNKETEKGSKISQEKINSITKIGVVKFEEIELLEDIAVTINLKD